MTSVLRLLAFSQPLVSSSFLRAGRPDEYKAVLHSFPEVPLVDWLVGWFVFVCLTLVSSMQLAQGQSLLCRLLQVLPQLSDDGIIDLCHHTWFYSFLPSLMGL